MSEWLELFPEFAAWLAGASVLMFVGSLLALPLLITRMDAEYFVREPESRGGRRGMRPAGRIVVTAVRNLLGALLVIVGLAMLVLPGQGLLSILIGISFLDFPGKRRFELLIIRRPAVLRAVNWMRRRANRRPLVLPEDADGG